MSPFAAGIIAAGHGARLSAASPGTPKPLVPVRGRPLIHWVAAGLRAAGADSLTVLINGKGDAVRDYLERELRWADLEIIQRDTESSWESFRLVSHLLAPRAERFLISTVDAIVPPAEARRFATEAFRDPVPAAALALTRFVDDEKPLWADLAPDGTVEALGGEAARRDAVTAGLYALTRPAAERMPGTAAYGRLRDFWSDLVKSGGPVRGVVLADTVDVDRPEDIPAAEKVALCFDV